MFPKGFIGLCSLWVRKAIFGDFDKNKFFFEHYSQWRTGRWYLSGVTSYGEACAGRGVYVRTTAFESWIAQTIAAN
jgi:hypothetical protein